MAAFFESSIGKNQIDLVGPVFDCLFGFHDDRRGIVITMGKVHHGCDLDPGTVEKRLCTFDKLRPDADGCRLAERCLCLGTKRGNGLIG